MKARSVALIILPRFLMLFIFCKDCWALRWLLDTISVSYRRQKIPTRSKYSKTDLFLFWIAIKGRNSCFTLGRRRLNLNFFIILVDFDDGCGSQRDLQWGTPAKTRGSCKRLSRQRFIWRGLPRRPRQRNRWRLLSETRRAELLQRLWRQRWAVCQRWECSQRDSNNEANQWQVLLQRNGQN